MTSYDMGHMPTSPIISRVSSPMKVSTSPSRKHRSISRWVVTYIYKVTGVSSPLGRLPKSFIWNLPVPGPNEDLKGLNSIVNRLMVIFILLKRDKRRSYINCSHIFNDKFKIFKVLGVIMLRCLEFRLRTAIDQKFRSLFTPVTVKAENQLKQRNPFPLRKPLILQNWILITLRLFKFGLDWQGKKITRSI